MQVMGVGLGDRSALALFSRRDLGHLRASLLEDRLVASCDALVVAHGQALLGALDDLSACDEQQLVHLARPRVVVAVGYGLQFSEQVRAAELMLALGVGEVGFPAVMDDEAAVARDDAEGVDRLTAAVAVQALDGDGSAGTHMDPVVFPVHAQRGFVDMEHRHVEELVDGGALPRFQGLMQTRDEAEQGGLGEQPSGHRLDHGRSALERDHLSTQQVHDIGDDPGSVLHRARHGRGEAALGPGVAARTGLDLGGDLTFDGLEDDIDLDALLVCGACGPGQVVSALPAPGDRAGVRRGDRAQVVGACVARLRSAAAGPRFAFGVGLAVVGAVA